MTASIVTRPIFRQFKARFAREIAAHVRGGGHALVWESPSRARLVLPVPKEGDEHDLALWSLLDLGKSRWKVIPRGTLRGLATALVPRDCFDVVRHRAERDSIFPGTQRTIALDCLECGACCKDNLVVLEDADLERFAEGGRADLGKAPYTRKADGQLVLRLLKSKACRHLESDNKCAIYTLRPNACSTFPVGSECCLFSREEELGIIDGLDEGKTFKKKKVKAKEAAAKRAAGA
jgi:Fe-S-cluster containining protein